MQAREDAANRAAFSAWMRRQNFKPGTPVATIVSHLEAEHLGNNRPEGSLKITTLTGRGLPPPDPLQRLRSSMRDDVETDEDACRECERVHQPPLRWLRS